MIQSRHPAHAIGVSAREYRPDSSDMRGLDGRNRPFILPVARSVDEPDLGITLDISIQYLPSCLASSRWRSRGTPLRRSRRHRDSPGSWRRSRRRRSTALPPRTQPPPAPISLRCSFPARSSWSSPPNIRRRRCWTRSSSRRSTATSISICTARPCPDEGVHRGCWC